MLIISNTKQAAPTVEEFLLLGDVFRIVFSLTSRIQGQAISLLRQTALRLAGRQCVYL
jgi:hypothetical protein